MLTLEPLLILMVGVLFARWDILTSLPLVSIMRAHVLWGLKRFANLNLFKSFRFDLIVPCDKLILAMDMPASKSFTIWSTSFEEGLKNYKIKIKLKKLQLFKTYPRVQTIFVFLLV